MSSYSEWFADLARIAAARDIQPDKVECIYWNRYWAWDHTPESALESAGLVKSDTAGMTT